MKHTKGEWIENPKARGNIQSKDTGRSIASCMGYSSNLNSDEIIEENYANAKLIAAAPELLEALTTIEGAFWTGGESYEFRVTDLKQIARIAIKKATQ